MLKHFCTAKFQPEANAHIQVTNRNEEYVWVHFPTFLFSTSIQSFLYGKTIFLLTFKNIEIRVFLSNDYIWKEFDPASFYMNFNGSQKKERKRLYCTQEQEVWWHAGPWRDQWHWSQCNALLTQNSFLKTEIILKKQTYGLEEMATSRRWPSSHTNGWSFFTAETKQFLAYDGSFFLFYAGRVHVWGVPIPWSTLPASNFGKQQGTMVGSKEGKWST